MEMNRHLSIEQVRDQFNLNSNVKPKSDKKDPASFASILENKANELKFSKHANIRLETRHIDLSAEQMERLNNGKEMSSEKGIKNSLVMLDDYAFIVNVPNNTVITAMDKTETKNNVFTNIDGAIIV